MDYLSVKFPPVELADEDGLLAISEELDAEMLLAAYTHGIFPWPVDNRHVLWFSPPDRTVLNLNSARFSKNFQRSFKNKGFEFRINNAFEDVIRHCSGLRQEEGTWITDKIIEAYIEFHRKGFAFSFEAWNAEGELAGGLYGVWINSFFAGESMFHLESGASKFALMEAVTFLRDEAGVRWLDAQMRTPLLARLGAVDICRDEYMSKLSLALEQKILPGAAGYHLKQKEYL